MPLLGIDALGELHRAHDVGEEDGDQLALAPERAPRRQDLLDEMARGVGARLARDRRRREGCATLVAKPRAGGVLVSARWADHCSLPIAPSHVWRRPALPRSRGGQTVAGATSTPSTVSIVL